MEFFFNIRYKKRRRFTSGADVFSHISYINSKNCVTKIFQRKEKLPNFREIQNFRG